MTRRMVIMSDLAEELVEEILCRVPATSVKQVRCTCKRWNSLFNDKRFIRKHLDKSPKEFLTFMHKAFRVCSMTIDLHGIFSSVEVKTDQLSLADQRYNQFESSQVFHCEGLLLCIGQDFSIVVWNPCTGKKRWIQPIHCNSRSDSYALGSYQDSKSGNNSYKILCCWTSIDCDYGFEIYDEINSNSWRVLHFPHDFNLECIYCGVSLKGKTYWIACDEKEGQFSFCLLSFDYATEIFGRLPLPSQCPAPEDYRVIAISVVREDQLSVLFQPKNTSRTEIWVTDEIDDETKKVSRSMVLAVDLNPELDISHFLGFLVDEEKRLLVCCDKHTGDDGTYGRYMVYIVGVGNQVRQVDLGLASSFDWPFLFNYVPSLTPIQQGLRGER